LRTLSPVSRTCTFVQAPLAQIRLPARLGLGGCPVASLDNPEYWAYVQAEVSAIASEVLNDNTPNNKFDMGL